MSITEQYSTAQSITAQHNPNIKTAKQNAD
jgi:hypothetical protein